MTTALARQAWLRRPILIAGLLIGLSACGATGSGDTGSGDTGSGDTGSGETDPGDAASSATPLPIDESVPGIVNLDDADLLIEDLRVDPEIRAELSAELAIQLDIAPADADCLAGEIDVEDLLAMSASNADEGALERILVAFDSCDVPRSVFDQ